MKKVSIFISCLFFLHAITVSAQLSVSSNGAVSISNAPFYNKTSLSIGSDLPTLGGYYGIQEQLAAKSDGTSTGVLCRLREISNTNNLKGLWGYCLGSSSYKKCGVVGMIGTDVPNGAGVFGSTGTSSLPTTNGAYAGYFCGPTYVNGTLSATELITPSDMNIKENVISLAKEGSSSLNNLLCLDVIKYNYKGQPLTAEEENFINSEEDSIKEQIRNGISIKRAKYIQQKHYGLSAQELKDIYPDLVREGQDGTLGVNYIELVPILIRSIQELKQELDGVRSGSNKTRTANGNEEISQDITAKNILYQNNPNPFKEQTTIRFRLADDAQNACICIFDMTGKMLRKLPISSGEESVSIGGYELGEGMFLYTLMVNGQEIDTKRMIITK